MISCMEADQFFLYAREKGTELHELGGHGIQG